MTLGHWRRFIPDRTQLIVLTGVVITLVAAVGFVNLAVTRGAVQAELQSYQAQVTQAREQRQRLLDELGRAQRGENLAPKAYDYYGKAPEGTTIILPAAPAKSAAPGQARRSEPPYWADWWKRLAQP